MVTDYTLPKAGEHVIGYAYPGSDTATKLGQATTGCMVVWLVGETHAHANYNACIDHVSALGTRPGRWSMDHPWNQHLYTHPNESPKAREWHQRLLAEEAQRAAAAARTGECRAGGGSVSVDLDRTPGRTVVTETHRDADGHGVAIRNAGELWGL